MLLQKSHKEVVTWSAVSKAVKQVKCGVYGINKSFVVFSLGLRITVPDIQVYKSARLHVESVQLLT